MSAPEHIELIARGLILHQGRVLLCQSLNGGYHYLPGGHIEFAEPAARALARELHEELGLHLHPGRLLLVSEHHFITRGRAHHEVNLMFHVEHPADPATQTALAHVQSQEPDIAFAWVDLAALAETDLRPAEIKAYLMAGGPDQPPTAAWLPMPAAAD